RPRPIGRTAGLPWLQAIRSSFRCPGNHAGGRAFAPALPSGVSLLNNKGFEPAGQRRTRATAAASPTDGRRRVPQPSQTPLLDRVTTTDDLRRMPENQLRQIADELRHETISAVSVTGGHLGAGLGVVELTVALHYVFDTPRDRIVWDVGHQAYPHKILTGRRDRIRTLRQG